MPEPKHIPTPRRVPGHKLALEWSGEYGAESSSTGYCSCGEWSESASSQKEVRNEYGWHKRKMAGLPRY